MGSERKNTLGRVCAALAALLPAAGLVRAAAKAKKKRSSAGSVKSPAKKALVIASMASMLDMHNRSNIEILDSFGYEITLAASFGREDSNSAKKNKLFYEEMVSRGYKVVPIEFSRSFLNIFKQLRSFIQVRKLLKNRFDLVHCNSPICSAMTRLLYRRYRTEYGGKIVYTAHGFHFYDGAPLKNWLIYYPIEKLLSGVTDVIVTINKEDYERALRKFHARRTVYVPGVGVDTARFMNAETDRDAVRASLGIGRDDTMLISVGELNENKHQRVIIDALEMLGDKSVHYVIAGRGEMNGRLRELAEKKNVNVHLLGYRTDIPELYHSADIFVLPSLREGLNVSLMEAMASGKPCVVSKIRGNTELIEDSRGGYLCDPTDAKAFAESIRKLRSDPAAAEKMGELNRKKIAAYGKDTVSAIMMDIYSFRK